VKKKRVATMDRRAMELTLGAMRGNDTKQSFDAGADVPRECGAEQAPVAAGEATRGWIASKLLFRWFLNMDMIEPAPDHSFPPKDEHDDARDHPIASSDCRLSPAF
jgi:hypothetical protein